MRIPERLIPLVDTGVLQDVLRPLKSGKEAAVYLVEAQDELRVAKVYKEAHERSFHQRSDYTEGRKVKNSREQRAMDKRSRYGREESPEPSRFLKEMPASEVHWVGKDEKTVKTAEEKAAAARPHLDALKALLGA